MESHLILRRRDREALREEWFQRAGQAFERMFGKANQDQLITFTQREDMACALGQELSQFLLEKHVAADVQVKPSEKRPPCCPRCQQPAQQVSERKPQANLPERSLTTRAGEITMRRQRWRCRKCRIVFFSARPQAGFGDGRVQPAAVGEGSAAGGQGAFLQRGE